MTICSSSCSNLARVSRLWDGSTASALRQAISTSTWCSTTTYLLCAEKEETVVKYSILNGSQQLFAAKYLPYMPTEEELRNMIENNVRLLESGKEESVDA